MRYAYFGPAAAEEEPAGLEAELTAEVGRIRDRAEDEKEAVRRDAKLA